MNWQENDGDLATDQAHLHLPLSPFMAEGKNASINIWKEVEIRDKINEWFGRHVETKIINKVMSNRMRIYFIYI